MQNEEERKREVYHHHAVNIAEWQRTKSLDWQLVVDKSKM